MRSRTTDSGSPSAAGASDVSIPVDRPEARALGALDPGALNVAWADRFVAGLCAAGVRDAVICPGSRSAPLVLAFDRSPIATHVALDERSGAFFALGLAKASRRPAALLCTSGSAAANFFPAIVEAASARVPLVVATADRPPELRDTGAPQTIDQLKLFGDLVRWFVEVGTPEPQAAMLDYAGSLGIRAVSEATRAPAGPVHLNFAFREPLLPDPDALPSWMPTGEALAPPEPLPPSPRAVERLAKRVRSLRRGLLVCGPDDPAPGFAASVARLGELTGYPVLADPLSQVRFGAARGGPVLGAYDAFLRDPAFAERHAPEIVIQFGAAPTSKTFHAYATRHPGAAHVLIDPGVEWRSPGRRARELVAGDSFEVARALTRALEGATDPLPSWRQDFEKAERTARDVIAKRLEDTPAFREGKVPSVLLDVLPERATLYVGNSMPVRDLDLFAPAHERPVRVLGNRGASGIDGTVSSALGASAGQDGPLLLVTGDLSFHHDLNALHLARGERVGATIVVVHNDGGGIFSFLPAARHGAFERYFGTPHGLDFTPATAAFGIPYSRPRDWEELRARVRASLQARATEVIEIRTDRDENRAWHQAIWDEVARAVARDVS